MNRPIVVPQKSEDVAKQVVDAIFRVHRTLGPGLLESAYAECLDEELRMREISFYREAGIPLVYGSKRLELGFRADFIIEDSLLIELKAIESLLPVHSAQVITYLKLTRLPLGLLVNMNVPRVKDGIHRLFNPGTS